MAKTFDITSAVPKASEDTIAADEGALAAAGKLSGTSRLKNAREIPITRIKPDSSQPRTSFDKETLKELTTSIKENGILEPLIVEYEEKEDFFKIIAGERRWRAAKLAKLNKLPCLIKDDIDQATRLTQQLTENMQREDLSPIEKAKGLDALRTLLGDDATWEAVEAKTGISRAHRKKLISYLKLPEEVFPLVTSERNARALLRVKDQPKEMQSVIKAIKSGDRGNDLMALTDHTVKKKKPANGQLQKTNTHRLTISYSDDNDLLQQLQKLLRDVKQRLKNTN